MDFFDVLRKGTLPSQVGRGRPLLLSCSLLISILLSIIVFTLIMRTMIINVIGTYLSLRVLVDLLLPLWQAWASLVGLLGAM